MRFPLIFLAAVTAFLPALPCSAAIDHLQKEDGQRLVVGLLNLYYNIGKGLFAYTKDTALALDDMPKAVATDVFQVGQKGAPEAYYMTERERQEKEKQKKMEERLRKREEQEKLLQEGVSPSGKSPLTSIKP